ncbi:MAG: class I poly(R)-hydroxyalkanoic acid synthase [Betaproteobacteria bacterium]|nr:class I poly(R)-hydroxyalkanoic acid synthase [Betaproteobacteria bacterium]
MSEDQSGSFAQAGGALLQNFLKLFPLGSELGQVWQSLLAAHSADPSRLGTLQTAYLQQQLALWGSMLARQSGKPAGPVATTDKGDKRFAGREWRESPYYDYLRQAYLLNSRFLNDLVETAELDEPAKHRLRFYTRQLIDAMSPANFAATNPEALRLALETKGESLHAGIRHLIEDVEKGRVSMSDESAFDVGGNLAVTPGEVVFENELIQLIQYQPATAKVRKLPLLMVPPCINKFYILDLQPENSFVRYAVEQGNTVFMLSWRNITEDRLGRLTWDDYIAEGVMKAIEVVRAIGRSDKINALGFCVGGTLLAAALALLRARGEERVASVTLLATMLDFSYPGDIGVFVDEASMAAREAAIGKGGILPGRELAFVFSALRANDLVWSYVVNNYLKGKTPEAFDILYWNADSTNLPGPMYCWYVRNMYLENKLREPGELSMCGVPVDLGAIRLPTYILATREDHIVPWKTAYLSTRHLKGDTRFVLGASGHVAGVINPPSTNRRSYWRSDRLSASAEEWLAGAEETPGSWWLNWNAWLEGFSGGERAAPKKSGNAKFKAIEPAPGRYVKVRV